MVFDVLADQQNCAQWLPSLNQTLEQLGRQLGDNKYAIRSAARRRLSRMGQLARPSIERWIESDDAEIAAAARFLLEGIKSYASAQRMHAAWQEKSRAIRVLGESPEKPVQ
jgi:hypothetical protein